ncbi:hypothetical protein LTR94_037684, partial [Friedmanniomyces endolithicus]
VEALRRPPARRSDRGGVQGEHRFARGGGEHRPRQCHDPAGPCAGNGSGEPPRRGDGQPRSGRLREFPRLSAGQRRRFAHLRFR